MPSSSWLRALLALVPCLSLAVGAVAAEPPARVFAAASLFGALEDLAGQWERQGHPRPVLAFGASSTLAKQVEAGAPADAYLAADTNWMDYVARSGRLEPGSRRDLLGNALVLVARRESTLHVDLRRGDDFAGAFTGRLCMGEPGSVPAGIYGRQALEALGYWDSIAARVVGTDDVRAALAFVERGACELAIVYATDAVSSSAVRVVARFDPATHRPIVYPAALVQGARPEGRRFFEFITGAPAARRTFERYGFVPLDVAH